MMSDFDTLGDSFVVGSLHFCVRRKNKELEWIWPYLTKPHLPHDVEGYLLYSSLWHNICIYISITPYNVHVICYYNRFVLVTNFLNNEVMVSLAIPSAVKYRKDYRIVGASMFIYSQVLT